MPMKSYQVSVASHLSEDWNAIDGIAGLTTGYDSAGLPTTELLVQVADQSHIVPILCELHAGNVAILSMNFLRATEEVGTAPR